MNIILINGPMAVGKSTICGELDKKLEDYIFVDRQYLKSVMLRKLDREDSRPISKKVMIVIIKELIHRKKNILIQELPFNSLMKNVDLSNYEVFNFFIQCSVKTAKQRDIERSKKTRSELVEETHKQIIPQENSIIINTEKYSINECVEKIISLL